MYKMGNWAEAVTQLTSPFPLLSDTSHNVNQTSPALWGVMIPVGIPSILSSHCKFYRKLYQFQCKHNFQQYECILAISQEQIEIP